MVIDNARQMQFEVITFSTQTTVITNYCIMMLGEYFYGLGAMHHQVMPSYNHGGLLMCTSSMVQRDLMRRLLFGCQGFFRARLLVHTKLFPILC